MLPSNAFHDLNITRIGKRISIESTRMLRPFAQRWPLRVILPAFIIGCVIAGQGPLLRTLWSTDAPLAVLLAAGLGICVVLVMGHQSSFLTLSYARTMLSWMKCYQRVPKAILLLLNFAGIGLTTALTFAVFEAGRYHIDSQVVAGFYVGLIIGVHALLDTWIVIGVLLCLAETVTIIMKPWLPSGGTSNQPGNIGSPRHRRSRITHAVNAFLVDSFLILPQVACWWTTSATDLGIRVTLLLTSWWLCRLVFRHEMQRRVRALNRSLRALLKTIRVIDAIQSISRAWSKGDTNARKEQRKNAPSDEP